MKGSPGDFLMAKFFFGPLADIAGNVSVASKFSTAVDLAPDLLIGSMKVQLGI